MTQNIVLFISLLTVWMAVGCNKASDTPSTPAAAPLPEDPIIEENAGETDPNEEAEEDPTEAPPATMESLISAGNFGVTRVTNAKSGVNLQTAAGSALAGASINIPPGALAINTADFALEPAAPMGEDILSHVNLNANVQKVGVGMSIQPTTAMTLAINMEVTLPPPSQDFALVQVPTQYVVLFRYFKDGMIKAGVIPTSAIAVTEAGVTFAAPGFGSYQVTQLDQAVNEPLEATATESFFRNENCLRIGQVGSDFPLVSLQETPVSFARIKKCGYYINSHNQTNLKVGGRCYDNGGIISLSGAIDATYTCQEFNWGEGRDVSALADGNHVLTISTTYTDGRVNAYDVTLKKDTVKAEFVINDQTFPGLSANQWDDATVPDYNDSRFADITYTKWTQLSGPGTFTVTSLSGSSQNMRFAYASTAGGAYQMKLEIMDAHGNHSEDTGTLTTTGEALDQIELITPQNFSASGQLSDDGSFVSLGWADRSSEDEVAGYLFARRIGAAVTWQPTDGQTYSTGFVDDHHEILGTGGHYGFTDSETATGRTYHYAIWEIGADGSFSTTPAVAEVTLAPASMNQLGFVGGSYNKIAGGAGVLAAAREERGVAVYDISNSKATSPELVKLIDVNPSQESVKDVIISGTILYVLVEYWLQDRVDFYDIADLQAISKVGTYAAPTDDGIDSLAVVGSTLYTGEGVTLRVIDVNSPSAPSELGNVGVGTGPDIGVIGIEGNYAFLGCGSTLRVVDVSAPNNLNIVQSTSNGTKVWTDLTLDTSTTPNYLYLTYSDATDVGVIRAEFTGGSDNVRFPFAAVKLDAVDSGTANNLALHGGQLLFTTSVGGIHSTNLALSTIAHTLSTNGKAWDFSIVGNHLYLADDFGGLLTVNISDLTSLALVHQLPGFDTIEEISTSGTMTLAAAGWGGVSLLDSTDPLQPKLQDAYTILGTDSAHDANAYVYNAVATGTSIFLAADVEGVVKLNASDPTNLTFALRQKTGMGSVRDVALTETHVLALDTQAGLFVLAQSDLSIVGTAPTFTGRRLFYDGTYVYIARESSGIGIVDLSNPASPTGVVNTNNDFDLTNRTITDVNKNGNTLFLTDSGGYLVAVNAADPTKLSILDFVGNGSSGFEAMTRSGNRIYVAANAVHVFAIDNPNDIFFTGSLTTQAGYIKGAAVSGDYVYAADYSSSIGSGISIHAPLD